MLEAVFSLAISPSIASVQARGRACGAVINIENSVDLDDDNDGYPDSWEEILGSDPLNKNNIPMDTDNDKAPDGDSDNTQPWMDTDDDNDGIEDSWEMKYNMDPLNYEDAQLDYDKDGLTNKEEHDANTDPWVPDRNLKVTGESKDIDLTGILIIIIIILSVLIIVVYILIHKKKQSVSSSTNDYTQQNKTSKTYSDQGQINNQPISNGIIAPSNYQSQVPPQAPTPTNIPLEPTTQQYYSHKQPPINYYQHAPNPTYYRCEYCGESITDYYRCQYCGWER